ncbi:TetR/AcrR family transcriptional regulator [Falsiroseomonas sp. HW251]|uniref:TetR/AcrR family transcriptional regulator n=1 Tax=Falsiroseomonas sp. HW251 TaxID=3390998 RepID=UPI003D310042
MAEQAGNAERRPRADAIRNRERVLEAAKAVFSRGGTEVGLETVAREAGVGIGTLYRHFPTREALYEAVYRREVDQLADLARQLAAEGPPLDGLRRWMQALIEFVATKKGMASALALAAHKPPELMAHTTGRMQDAIAILLGPAAEAGEVRRDIGPPDLLRAVIGLCYLQDGPGWQAQVMRLLDVFLDGLRLRPDAAGAPPGRQVRPKR